jgi:hypothetical protein
MMMPRAKGKLAKITGESMSDILRHVHNGVKMLAEIDESLGAPG